MVKTISFIRHNEKNKPVVFQDAAHYAEEGAVVPMADVLNHANGEAPRNQALHTGKRAGKR